MKHLLSFIIAALCSLTAAAKAPVYQPFCEEGKVWTVDYDWHWVIGNFYQEKHRLEGDTLIAGHTCKKMFCKPYAQDTYHYTGAYYDDGARVMYFAPGSVEARLAYDFSLKLGDEVEVWPIGGVGSCTLKVKEASSCTYGGRTFRKLYLEGFVPAGFDGEGERLFATWIEGVGGSVSPATNVDMQTLSGMYTVGLRCCSVGSDMLYFGEPDNTIYGKSYDPFVQEGKYWAVRCKGDEPDAVEYVKEYVIQGDTIIGGQAAKRMYEDGQYCGAFFDCGPHTYFIAPGTTTPHLYYNFSASCSYGCHITRVWHDGAYAQLYACTCCGWLEFGHQLLERSRLNFVVFESRDADYNALYCIKNNKIRDNYRAEWIEGIGSLAGPMQNWEYPDLDGAPATKLLACWTNDAIYYDTDGYAERKQLEEQMAQCRVWREGSTWEYYDEDGRLAETYTLEAYTKKYGTYYMPLVKNDDAIIGYIRTERGDSLVYARGFNASNGTLLPEVLLYDFTKSYEAGDVMRLGAAKSQSGSTGVDELRIEATDDAPLTFFYDVFEDGDCIPQWNGFIYKVGCLEGPMAYFYNQVSDKKPSAKNLSHLIFGNKKRRGAPTKFFPFGNAYNLFAFDFFNQLCETSDADDDAGGNVVASPLSAQFALSMLQNGAAGNTLKEMQFALGTSSYTVDEVNAYNRELIGKLQRPIVMSEKYRELLESDNQCAEYCGQTPVDIDELIPQMEIANGIWTAPWLPVNKEFFATNAANYDAAAETADFSLQSTMDAIDEWVSEKTHGTIPSINEQPNDEIAMMLINTLFFKGSWQNPFKSGDGIFTNADGSRVIAPMMYNDDDKPRAESENFKMVRVPYQLYADKYDEGRDQVKYFMGLYLPKHDGAVLTTAEWQCLNADAVSGRTTLVMPRFTVDQEMELNDVLKVMGMQDAFDKRQANFSALSPEGTYVSKVKQLAHITVDERGTTAAATSVVISGTTGIDHRVLFEMKIDRPFYFTIETSDGDILFIGRVSHLDGPPAPDGIVLPASPPLNPKTSIYDLSGRRVYPELQSKGISDTKNAHGVYVVGGKKVVK